MEIIEEKEITIDKVKKILSIVDSAELKHFQKLALEYCNVFSSFDPKVSEKIVETLVKEFNLPRRLSVQIVNCNPSTKTELISIIQKTELVADEEKLEKILKILSENLKANE